jgi:hypothetical protein
MQQAWRLLCAEFPRQPPFHLSQGARKRRTELLLELREHGLAMAREDVPLPQDGSAPLHSLPVLDGYKCCEPGCHFLSASSKNVSRHCYTEHKLVVI